MLKQRCMLLQFISDLVNDETAALRERVMGLPEKRPFLLNVENAERNARKNVIALGEAAPLQLTRQSGGVRVNHMHTWIVCELSLQIASEGRIQLEQEQMRIRTHPSRDFARVHAFTWAVFCNHARPVEIHLTGHAFHHRF